MVSNHFERFWVYWGGQKLGNCHENWQEEVQKQLIQKEVEKAAIPSYIRRKENKLTQLDDLK